MLNELAGVLRDSVQQRYAQYRIPASSVAKATLTPKGPFSGSGILREPANTKPP